MITLLTKQDKIDSVAKRWLQQYPSVYQLWSHQTHKRLIDEKPATENAVESIIGNRSWTKLECDICEKDMPALVVFESPFGYHNHSICGACIHTACNLIPEKI